MPGFNGIVADDYIPESVYICAFGSKYLVNSVLVHMEFAPNGCRSIGREHQLSGLTTHGRASETPLVCRRPKETRGVTRVLRAPSFKMIHRERAATVPLAERVYANTLSHHSAVGIVEHSVRRERSTTFARLFRQ